MRDVFRAVSLERRVVGGAVIEREREDVVVHGGGRMAAAPLLCFVLLVTARRDGHALLAVRDVHGGGDPVVERVAGDHDRDERREVQARASFLRLLELALRGHLPDPSAHRRRKGEESECEQELDGARDNDPVQSLLTELKGVSDHDDEEQGNQRDEKNDGIGDPFTLKSGCLLGRLGRGHLLSVWCTGGHLGAAQRIGGHLLSVSHPARCLLAVHRSGGHLGAVHRSGVRECAGSRVRGCLR